MRAGTVREDLAKGWVDGRRFSADDFVAGERVYLYYGATYGCIGYGVAVTRVPDETPFYEIPDDAVDWDERDA